MSVEGDVSFWKWLTGGIASAAGGLFGYHKYMEGKLSKKADKTEVDSGFRSIHDEMTIQRGHIAKLFDQIRDSDQRAQDRHERLMEHLHRHNGSG